MTEGYATNWDEQCEEITPSVDDDPRPERCLLKQGHPGSHHSENELWIGPIGR